MRKLLLTATLLLITTLSFAIDITDSILSGGVYRKFIIHAPGTSVATNLPVMFVLHGDGGNGAGIKSYTGFDSIANQQNFMAVYPSSHQAGGLWNKYVDNVAGDAGTGNVTAVDDVQFFNDLILHLCNTYQINKTKVYATGHSGGAFMCYHLALRLADKIAGIAPVAGSLWGDNAYLTTLFTSATYVKVPIYHIHGDADATVAYPDANHTANAWSEWPFSSFAYYGCANNTYTSTTNVAGTTVAGTVKQLSFCAGPASSTTKEVYLIRMVGGGHGWPTAAGYKPALAIWNFCNQYNIAASYSCGSAPTPNYVGTVVGGIASANTAQDIHTAGRFILGPQGDTIILRGVNYAPYNWGYDSLELRINNIAQTNANAIRLVWYTSAASGPSYTSLRLIDSALNACKTNGIVGILEIHDETCNHDSSALMNIANWWTSSTMRNILNKYRGYVILNVANEALGSGAWGWLGGSANSYKNIYKNVISTIRSGTPSITCPIMLDATECGGNESIFTTGTITDTLIAHDPLHNIIFSVHAYWPIPSNTSAVLTSKITNIKNKNAPIILGEVANTSDCSDVILIDTILAKAKQADIGWLAWSWDRDNCAARQVTTNGAANSLTSYGTTILQNQSYGINSTAVKILPPPPIALAVQNIILQGKLVVNKAMLSWQAAKSVTDINILGSTDGANFEQVLAIANGENNAAIHSTYNYYKLQGYSSSAIIESNTINLASNNAIAYYAQHLQIINKEIIDYKLYNSNGTCIWYKNLLEGEHNINLEYLPAGLYILVSNKNTYYKFIK
jgi:poly(3-hydroxybutyrate) depolymerase